MAKQKEHYEEFSRELSEISERIQKRKEKDEAARAGNQDAAKDEETRPEDEDKLYDPDA